MAATTSNAALACHIHFNRPLLQEHLKTHGSVENRMRMAKFLQNWVAGLHGVGTWHGAGPRQNQMTALYRDIDLEKKKRMARELAGMGD